MLPTRRLLNLVYFWGTDGITAESKRELDDALAAAANLDVAAAPRLAPATPEQQQAEHVPGTAPRWIKPPDWWKGDRAAYRSSVKAADQLGEPAAKKAGVA
jgi:hypothetical protein